jgi:hypothetical protein
VASLSALCVAAILRKELTAQKYSFFVYITLFSCVVFMGAKIMGKSMFTLNDYPQLNLNPFLQLPDAINSLSNRFPPKYRRLNL